MAAFRATLEEVREADLLLHVRDISHPDSAEQKDDVMQVLGGILGQEGDQEWTNEVRTGDQAGAQPVRRQEAKPLSANINDTTVIEVWNKIDLMETPPAGPGIPVSALTGTGCDRLLAALDERLSAMFMTVLAIDVPAAQGDRLAWLYRNATVLANEEQDGIMHITARMTHENAARWRGMQAG